VRKVDGAWTRLRIGERRYVLEREEKRSTQAAVLPIMTVGNQQLGITGRNDESDPPSLAPYVHQPAGMKRPRGSHRQ
jgi:hypothetical protein